MRMASLMFFLTLLNASKKRFRGTVKKDLSRLKDDFHIMLFNLCNRKGSVYVVGNEYYRKREVFPMALIIYWLLHDNLESPIIYNKGTKEEIIQDKEFLSPLSFIDSMMGQDEESIICKEPKHKFEYVLGKAFKKFFRNLVCYYFLIHKFDIENVEPVLSRFLDLKIDQNRNNAITKILNSDDYFLICDNIWNDGYKIDTTEISTVNAFAINRQSDFFLPLNSTHRNPLLHN
ncbi:uncharacterized protein VNE69_09074 [Vairimorpha necatrix]|uniref:Uncharacterized protein n=1 Tax=Vairimorpha necatrix TaxID=6039 RepID=A0AAX4JES5_9MICR